MSRCILLLNRGSGGNERGLNAEEVCAMVEQAFKAAGHEISCIQVEPTDIERQLEKAISQKPDTILIAGGDGTVSTGARLLGGTGIAMGVLPMGTFNLAARDLGIPLEIEDAARVLAEAIPEEIDVLDVAGHSCLCTTIFGFYPEFSDVFEKRDHGGQWWKKTLKLLFGMKSTFEISRPIPLSWDADGEKGSAKTKFSAFVPGRYQETAGIIPGRTDFLSGNMTAYIGTHRTSTSALRGIFDYVLGQQEHSPDVTVLRAPSITLRAKGRSGCKVMLDGEILRLKFPIELRIIPRHLKVLRGAAPEETQEDEGA